MIVSALAAIALQTSDATDWSALARADILAAHQNILDNHPGAHDPLNPDFRDQMQSNLAEALELADQATSEAGFREALLNYGSSYNDNHLGIAAPYTYETYRWPGFLVVRSLGGEMLVIDPDEDHAELDGARLSRCDGQDMDDLMRERIFRFRPVELREVDWIRRAPTLMLDYGHPFLETLQSCDVNLADGNMASITLDWQSIDRDTWWDRLGTFQGNAERPVTGIRRFGENGFWINLPNFSPNDEQLPQIQAVMDEIRDRGAEIAAADVIVFDVRGNNGGSSEWGLDVAESIWSAEYLASQLTSSSAVDWRASPGNIEHMNWLVPFIRSRGQDRVAEIFDGIRLMMIEAEAAGEPLVRVSQGEWVRPYPDDGAFEPAEQDAGPVIDNPVTAQVYLLTVNGSCASACLDFADIILSLENTQLIGWPTGADSLYMELREIELPSGRARMGLPTKVYRGRERGSMEAYQPTHRYEAFNYSTEALEAWVNELVNEQND